MNKNIKRMAMLLMAAAMFSTMACTKEDENQDNTGTNNQPTNSISEASLVGSWGYKSDHTLTGKDMVIKDDHTVSFNGMTYEWTISGKKFTATNGKYYKMEFTISSISKKEMVIEGATMRYNQSEDEWRTETDISGTIVKTVTETLANLPDEMVVGNWTFSGTLGSGWPLTIDADHTCTWNYNITCNWDTEGTLFKARGTGNYPRFKMQFTVDSITTSATMSVMYVTGDYKDSVFRISGWEETGDDLVGRFTKRF